MNAKKLLSLWGLKWNPFSPELPSEGLLVTAKIESFAWRVEQLVQEGGFALITGESGTGKELVAGAVHHNSLRKDKSFIKVNCAALHENLLESELFGHEKGAFTGATEQRKGRFELADKGTLFLDEIGDMSATTQAKVLRVLQEGEFERLGGTKTIKSDVRVIAATHRDLEKMVDEGSFRQDLYFRLNVVPLHLPPLRERPMDIPALAEHFLERYSTKNKKDIRSAHFLRKKKASRCENLDTV